MNSWIKKYYNNRSIRVKINLSIVGAVGIILVILLTIVSLRSRSIVLKYAEKTATSIGKEYSYHAVEYINNKESALQMLASSFESQQGLLDLKFDIYQNTINRFGADEEDIYAIWYVEDFRMRDSTLLKTYMFCEDKSVDTSTIFKDIREDPGYKMLRSNDKVWISEPSLLNGMWVFHIAIPYKVDGRIAGAIGFVVETNFLQETVNKAMHFEDGFCKIISWEGTIVSYPDKSKIGTKDNEGEYTNIINEKIKSKQEYSNYIWSKVYQTMAFKVYTPINFAGTDTAWAFCTVVPENRMLKDTRELVWASFILIIIGLLVLAWVTNLLSRSLAKPIKDTAKQLSTIAEGRLNEVSILECNTKDEIGQMVEALNSLTNSQKHLAHFANEVGKGNLEVSIEAKNEHDVIGKSMVEMKQNLINARDAEERRRKEDDIIGWKVTGNSRIHEAIRKENLSIKHLCSSILRELISYSNSIQGGIFVIDDTVEDEKHVDLVACIAYNRLKMINKQIPIEEGLIGRCIFEREPIMLTEIPQDYLSITSGLGEKTPDFLALIPLISNDNLVGVLEIASFNKFDKDVLEYLTKSCESLASAISNVKINERTQLLLEQTKNYAEEIGAQEEELRQNMEEMQAAQEEMFRKSKEYEEVICSLNEKLNLIDEEKNKP